MAASCDNSRDIACRLTAVTSIIGDTVLAFINQGLEVIDHIYRFHFNSEIINGLSTI